MAEYNEDAYKLARKAYIEFNCPFERALLSRCVGCDRSRKLNLAEREAIACSDPAAREDCLSFYQALHENAQFALKITPDSPWPFGKEIRGVLKVQEPADHRGQELTLAGNVAQALRVGRSVGPWSGSGQLGSKPTADWALARVTEATTRAFPAPLRSSDCSSLRSAISSW